MDGTEAGPLSTVPQAGWHPSERDAPPGIQGDEAALCAPTIPVTILPPNALGGALRAEIFPSRL